MAKLRVSEVYLSIQGEGPRVGAATVFIRFAGCNLRCPAWPCDTPHAIFPELFKEDAELLDPEEVLERVRKVATPGAHICFTGGEPFLQNHEQLHSLSNLLALHGYSTQEVFTNGTLRIPSWAHAQLHFVMDWKLAGSGEAGWADKMRDARYKNISQFTNEDVIKFTIASYQDFQEAVSVWTWFVNKNPKVYYGVVWGKVEAKNLIEWVLDDDSIATEWMYNHQIHNVIWDRDKRGI